MEKAICERCPEFSPAGTPDDFCIPEQRCPERIEQPQLTSPTSCMTHEQLTELEEKIREANGKLLDLGLSDDREEREVFQRAFDGLVGQRVRVILHCPSLKDQNKRVKKTGRVMLVGFDFVVLRNKKHKEVIIPFHQVKRIKETGRFAEPFAEATLDEIDPCLRRMVTFQFGNTVASSPELIQLFFRLRLVNYLLLLQNKRIKVRLEDRFVTRRICNLSKETITLQSGNKQTEIPISNICYLTVLKEPSK